jgi:hypothetical protein
MIYKLQTSLTTGKTNLVKKIEEGFVTTIPFDPANTDYQEYLEWLAEGNEVLPADEPTAE